MTTHAKDTKAALDSIATLNTKKTYDFATVGTFICTDGLTVCGQTCLESYVTV